MSSIQTQVINTKTATSLLRYILYNIQEIHNHNYNAKYTNNLMKSYHYVLLTDTFNEEEAPPTEPEPSKEEVPD